MKVDKIVNLTDTDIRFVDQNGSLGKTHPRHFGNWAYPTICKGRAVCRLNGIEVRSALTVKLPPDFELPPQQDDTIYIVSTHHSHFPECQRGDVFTLMPERAYSGMTFGGFTVGFGLQQIKPTITWEQTQFDWLNELMHTPYDFKNNPWWGDINLFCHCRLGNQIFISAHGKSNDIENADAGCWRLRSDLQLISLTPVRDSAIRAATTRTCGIHRYEHIDSITTSTDGTILISKDRNTIDLTTLPSVRRNVIHLVSFDTAYMINRPDIIAIPSGAAPIAAITRIDFHLPEEKEESFE